MNKEFWKGVTASVAVVGFAATAWFVTSTVNIDARNEIVKLKEELSVCRQEAQMWYLSSTSLSDAIAFAALKGLKAENVDTNLAIPFAVKGHELNCIRPQLPTG